MSSITSLPRSSTPGTPKGVPLPITPFCTGQILPVTLEVCSRNAEMHTYAERGGGQRPCIPKALYRGRGAGQQLPPTLFPTLSKLFSRTGKIRCRCNGFFLSSIVIVVPNQCPVPISADRHCRPESVPISADHQRVRLTYLCASKLQ